MRTEYTHMRSAEAPRTAAMPRFLRAYLSVLLSLWALSALPLGHRLRGAWPSTPLWFQPPFYDFGCFYDRLKLLHRPEFWTSHAGPVWDYPAPDVFVYQLFYAFNRGNGGEHKVFFGFLAYLLFAGAVLLCAGVALSREMRRRGVRPLFALLFPALSLLLSWPVFFSLQRGNIEFFLDAGIAVGLWAYVRRRWWLAAVLLGVFGSGKLYPLLLLSLLLPLRRWKEFALGLASAAAVTLLATRWIGLPPAGTQQSRGILPGLQSWVLSNSLTLETNRIGFDHSFFGFLKLASVGHPHRLMVAALAYAVLGAAAMLLLFFGRVWSMPRTNQLLLVSVAAVLLPPTSFDYTLILLLPVWGWLVLEACAARSAPQQSAWMMATMLLFAVLFAPEAFMHWHGLFLAGQLKMVCLLALLTVAAKGPLPEAERVLPELKALSSRCERQVFLADRESGCRRDESSGSQQ